jgi:hypothetical protein
MLNKYYGVPWVTPLNKIKKIPATDPTLIIADFLALPKNLGKNLLIRIAIGKQLILIRSIIFY